MTGGGLPLWVTGPSSLALLVGWRTLAAGSEAATTRAFAAQGEYKRTLHRAIWGSACLTAALTVLGRIAG
jgi:hypothetical protein